MTDEAVIKGTYIQLQTYKERPYVTLHIDFPEELHQEIIEKLGVPIKGTSKWVAVALLNQPEIPDSSAARENRGTEKSEGEKLRIRACCLCKDKEFQSFCANLKKIAPHFFNPQKESHARSVILEACNIKSRSELTTDVAAQKLFRELDRKFQDWKNYKDNLDREQ